jgi:hypothetical protein
VELGDDNHITRVVAIFAKVLSAQIVKGKEIPKGFAPIRPRAVTPLTAIFKNKEGKVAASAAEENRRLVVGQLAAAVVEDAWPIDQARPLLPPAAGREYSDAAAVRQHAGTDSWAVPSGGIAEAVVAGKSLWSHQGQRGCLTKADGKTAVSSFWTAMG